MPFTAVLLGDQWRLAGLALTALAPSLAFMGLSFAVNDVLVTQDRAHALRNLGLIEAVVRIGAVFLGAQLGLVQTALAFTIATFLVTLSRVFVAGHVPPVTVGDQLTAAVPGVLTGTGAGLLCLVAVLADVGSLPAWGEFLTLAALGPFGAVLAGLCWSVSRRAMSELGDILGLVGLARRVRARTSRSRSV